MLIRLTVRIVPGAGPATRRLIAPVASTVAVPITLPFRLLPSTAVIRWPAGRLLAAVIRQPVPAVRNRAVTCEIGRRRAAQGDRATAYHGLVSAGLAGLAAREHLHDPGPVGAHGVRRLVDVHAGVGGLPALDAEQVGGAHLLQHGAGAHVDPLDAHVVGVVRAADDPVVHAGSPT